MEIHIDHKEDASLMGKPNEVAIKEYKKYI